MYQQSVKKIFQIFETSVSGLSNAQAKNRLEKYGFNEIKTHKRTPIILQFFEEFQDIMVLILIGAVIIAFISGEKIDASIILFIVILNAFIGFIQKYRAEKAVEALKKFTDAKARVIRENEEMEIEGKYLVPGDIIIINEGDQISADSRLIEEHELCVSEAVLTGESVSIKKQANNIDKTNPHFFEHTNIVFMGTTVTYGTGKAIVFATGMNTQFGKIAHLTGTTKKDKSPLQKELHKIGLLAGKTTIVLSTILFIVGYFWQKKAFIETLLFSVGVAVAAVPEGLPATITMTLALGVQKLAKKNAIMKELSSVETLGSVTVICSDKTGTLTKNEMTVKELILQDYQFRITGAGYDPYDGECIVKKTNIHIGRHSKENEPDYDLKIIKKGNPKLFQSLELICRIASLCNNGHLIKKTLSLEKNQKTILGDPTEGCLLTMVEKAGFSYESLKRENKKIYELPFDSSRKMMTTIHKTDEKIIAYSKGALDNLLEKCESVYQNGKIVPLNNKLREKILKDNERLAQDALRVIGFALKELGKTEKKEYSIKEVEKNLIFVGLVGMIDPPRKEVKEAIRITKQAGIKVYMVTGDYGLTAIAIGKEIGLFKEKETVKIITGKELEYIETNELINIFKNEENIIFARVSPEHKLKIVSTLKKMGEIVAVTGDGVNDAPALKRADIGIAMGITGTDVSREAANMVLADDSFATIVTAIEEGRTIYENIKKFILYIFACNIGELVMIFSAILLSLEAPLTAILILCVNVGTDVFPALALGLEKAEVDIMLKPPRQKNDQILKKNFILHFTYIGIFIGILMTSTFIWTLIKNGWQWGQTLKTNDPIYLKASTLTFAFLVLIQMVHAFNSRSLKKSIFKLDIFSNLYLISAVTLSVLILVILVHVPFIQNLIRTTDLTLYEWGYILLGSLSIFIIEEVRKKFFTQKNA
ncbi:cation-transporting P-type ATPase [Candidatus Peregrinibacteria bacterium]|nr:cation-transporting P-type ATPase [Candidatus Peregrinibacteria bacterium]